MKYIFSIFLLLLLTACASTPMYTASKKPGTGQALVYIYWLPETTSATFSPNIVVNDNQTQNISNGTYLFSYLQAGQYKIGLKFGLKKLLGTFKFESGKTYFIKVTSGIRPIGLPYTLMNFRMRTVDSDTGSQEIKATRLAGELEL